MERFITFCVLVFHSGLGAAFPFPDKLNNLAYQQPLQYPNFGQPQASATGQSQQRYSNPTSYQHSASFGGVPYPTNLQIPTNPINTIPNSALHNLINQSPLQQSQNYGEYVVPREQPLNQQIQAQIQQQINEQIQDQILANQFRNQNVGEKYFSAVPVQNTYQRNDVPQTYLPLEQELPRLNPPVQWAANNQMTSAVATAAASAQTNLEPASNPNDPTRQLYHHLLKQYTHSKNPGINPVQFQNLWKQYADIVSPPKQQKRYLVIHPDGRKEFVDRLETIKKKHPKFVLINSTTMVPQRIETPNIAPPTETLPLPALSPDIQTPNIAPPIESLPLPALSSGIQTPNIAPPIQSVPLPARSSDIKTPNIAPPIESVPLPARSSDIQIPNVAPPIESVPLPARSSDIQIPNVAPPIESVPLPALSSGIKTPNDAPPIESVPLSLRSTDIKTPNIARPIESIPLLTRSSDDYPEVSSNDDIPSQNTPDPNPQAVESVVEKPNNLSIPPEKNHTEVPSPPLPPVTNDTKTQAPDVSTSTCCTKDWVNASENEASELNTTLPNPPPKNEAPQKNNATNESSASTTSTTKTTDYPKIPPSIKKSRKHKRPSTYTPLKSPEHITTSETKSHKNKTAKEKSPTQPKRTVEDPNFEDAKFEIMHVSDSELLKKLLGDESGDSIIFVVVKPVIEKDIKTIVYANGTTVEEVTETRLV